MWRTFGRKSNISLEEQDLNDDDYKNADDDKDDDEGEDDKVDSNSDDDYMCVCV